MYSLPTVASESNVTNPKEQYDAFRYTKDVTEYPYTTQYNSKEANAITPSEGPLTNHTLWTKQMQRVTGSVVAEGKIWLSYDTPVSTIKCLDAYTGETIWEKFSTSGVVSTSGPYLELSNNRVSTGFLYVVFDGAFQCYQALDGVLYWEVPVSEFQSFIGEDTAMGGEFAFVGPTSDEYIFTGDYFGGDPGDIMGAHVWAITKGRSGGTIEWATYVRDETDYWSGGPAAIADGVLYVGEYITNAHLNAIDAVTGDLLWSTFIGGYSTYATAVVDGVVFTNTSPGFDVPGGSILALDAQGGDILWRYDTIGIPMSNPIIYQNSIYQAVYLDDKLYALDKDNGELLWSMDSAGGGRGMTLANGKLYGTAYGDAEDGFFYCLDPETKDLVWKYQLMNTGVYSRGFAVADGIAYGGDLAGTFYAFGKGPTTTEMSLTDTNIASGTDVAVYGKVYDESPAHLGEPVVNSPVKLMAQKIGESTWSDIGTATTDAAGRFNIQWTPASEGTFKVLAKFDGSNSYGWSSAEDTIQVQTSTAIPTSLSAPMTDIYLAGSTIAIIAAIAVVGFLILRKK